MLGKKKSQEVLVKCYTERERETPEEMVKTVERSGLWGRIGYCLFLLLLQTSQ